MPAHASALVGVFAKLPQPGAVKTRLIPLLGERQAARFHQGCVIHTLTTACATPGCEVALWCAPDAERAFFDDCHHRFGVPLLPQGEGDLGERMLRAFTSGLSKHAKVIIVGADCPTLTVAHLAAAANALEHTDVVLVPAEDGGYVLIGARQVHGEMFAGVAWSSGHVLVQTRANLVALGLSATELDTLWDIDRPEDFLRLRAMPQYAHLCVLG